MTHASSRRIARLKGFVMGPYTVESAPAGERRHAPPWSNMQEETDLSGQGLRGVPAKPLGLSGIGRLTEDLVQRARTALVDLSDSNVRGF
jgi:hypothetical protein